MINTSLSWRNKEGNYPFLLSPVGKDYLWGGSRLNDDFAKNIHLDPLAESWECSTHPDGLSGVANGFFSGKTLAEVLKEHHEFLGSHFGNRIDKNSYNGELPILIKLIDAKKDLSVQVHPSDEYALTYENGQLGKTEMWYVLDAAPKTSLVYGFLRDVTKDEIRKSIETGKLENYLQKVDVEKDDVFFIESGTVHAIGAGALIAEIQENSNLTYRLYDYDRRDKNGNLRELHIDKALQVAKLESAKSPKQPLRVLKYKKGCASELLCRCKYFEVERMLFNTERQHDLVPMKTGDNSFMVLLCIAGCGMLFVDEDVRMPIFKGDCIFVPANSSMMRIHGKMQMLKVTC